ncbi:MAG: leucine-rich repeat domain-containing protein [Muribaculaceae bacterium]|nr:leucine-rich repeat domain-containing protein [Muribaculaceae bacterium]
MKQVILLFALFIATYTSVIADDNTTRYQWTEDERNSIERNWWDDTWMGGAFYQIEPWIYYEPHDKLEYKLDSIAYIEDIRKAPAYRLQIDAKNLSEGILKRFNCAWSEDFTHHIVIPSAVVPEKIEWKGKEYTVTALSESPGCQGIKLELPSTARYIYSNCYSPGWQTEVIFNEGLEVIMDNVFNTTHVECFSFPSTLRSIGSETCCDCPDLYRVEFNDGLISIGNGSFSKCPKITEVSLPESVIFLGKHTFNDCEEIEKVRLSRWLRNYCELEGIFNGCPNIKEIIYESNTPLEARNCFNKVNKEECVLYVPYRRAYVYAKREGWKEFKNIVELPQRPDALDENGNLAVSQINAELPSATEGYYTLDGIRYNEWNDIPHGTTVIYMNQKILKR